MAMNPQAMMKQAKKMQKKMEEIQAQAALETVEASAGGMVTAVVAGDLQVKSISIDPEAIDPEDVEMLQDMIVAAVNQGIADAQAMVNQKMSAVTGGLAGLF